MTVRRIGTTAWTGVILLVAAGLAAVPWGWASDSSFAVYLSTAAVVFAMVLTVAFRGEKRLPFLCDPLVLIWAFQAQFFVIGPVALVALAAHTYSPQPTARVTFVLLMFVAMVLFTFFGYQLGVASSLAERLPTFSGGTRLPRSWGLAGFLVLGIAACTYQVWDSGGILAMLGQGYGMSQGAALFQLAFHGVVGITIAAGWVVFGKASRLANGAFAVLLLIEFLYFGFLIGARKWLFYLFFGLVTVWLLRHGTRRLPKARLAVIMAILLAFFSVWGAVRARPVTEMLGLRAADVRQNPNRGLHMGYFLSVAEPFEIAVLVTQLFPDQEPYKKGSTLLVTVFGFIPRAIWPDKPVGIGKELTKYTDGVFYEPVTGHSLAPTLLGDFYANLGVLGVLLGGLLLGFGSRVVAAYATIGMVDGKQSSAARVLVFAVFVAGLAEVRSDMATLLAFYVLTGFPVITMLLFFRMDDAAAVRAMEPPR